jgi:alpha-beta hydrolase superfamily lysophospholipase
VDGSIAMDAAEAPLRRPEGLRGYFPKPFNRGAEMIRISATLVRRVVSTLAHAVIGGLAVGILFAVLYLNSRPDLKPWHRIDFDEEYTAASRIDDFRGYLALEERLFRQIDEKIVDALPDADRSSINRYHRGSLSDPGRWPRNWNRTFEFSDPAPLAGVLLLHGMSDSPYSLRAIGQRLNACGAFVIGLRLPGHGTAPSGLVDLRWEDMTAAVRLAMRHLRQRAGDAPLYMVGYSTGGTLAVNYALEGFDTPALPPVRKIVLISPAIGLTRLAALSAWQGRLGRWLGLAKLEWNSIQPEYNPFKYNSFAINAADQVYRLAQQVQIGLRAARNTGRIERLPDILAFQSAVDATVSTRAVAEGLFNKLDNPKNELVLFDINRAAHFVGLMPADPMDTLEPLLAASAVPYRVTLLSNKPGTSDRVAVYRYGSTDLPGRRQNAALAWPKGIHSLSHIALPFPPSDSLYGVSPIVDSPGIALGDITLRGERGVVNISAGEILRLRWNPFFPYLEQRVLSFFQLRGLTDRE